MVDADLVLYAIVWAIPVGLVLAGIFYAAHTVYSVREARAHRAARGPEPAMPDYGGELRQLNAEAAAALAEGRRTLEAARETLRRGLRG